MAVPFEQTSGRLQDRIARLIGVQLPGGAGRYKNGVLISPGDAASADQTRATDAAFDTQARGQRIQNIPSQAGTISTFDNRAVGFLNQARSDGRIETSRLPQLRGGTQGLPQPGDAAVPAGDLFRAKQTLIGANGLAPNRIYTPATLANATPQEILNEAAMLPSRFAIRDQRLQQGEQAAEAAALGGGGVDTGGVTTGGGLGGFQFPRFGGVGAASGFGYGGNPNASDLLFRDNKIDLAPSLTNAPVPSGARNVTGTAETPAAAALPGDDVEAAVTGAVARYRAAGGRDPQRAKQIADTARFLADPTGEISYQRQLARQQQAADAADRRAAVRSDFEFERQQRALAAREVEAERRNVSSQLGVVSREAAKAQASLWDPNMDVSDVTQRALGTIGYTGRVFTRGDAKDDLTTPDQVMNVLAERGDTEGQRKFMQAYLQARQQVIASRLEQNPEAADIIRQRDFLRERAQQLGLYGGAPAGNGAGAQALGVTGAPMAESSVPAAAAPLTPQDVADFAASVRGASPAAPAAEAAPQFSAPAWSLRGLGQRAATLAPAVPRVLSQGLDGFSQLPDEISKRGGALVGGVYSGDFRVPEGPGPIERLSRWFGRDVLGELMYGGGERRALAQSQQAKRETDAELARRAGDPAQALADLFAKRRAAEGNRLPWAERAALATSLGLPANAGTQAISRAAMAREQEMRRALGAN